MQLSIVTWNTWKYKQIVDHLPNFVHAKQIELDIPEIQTNLLTEISRDKCLQAFQQLQQACLVDDSGIYFHAFNDFPGALTKFIYQGIGLEGIQRIYTWIEDRSAVFQCVLSYMDEKLHEPLQFTGEIQGSVIFDYIDQEQKDTPLPYDLIFVPQGFDKPVVYDWERWWEINHRVRATEKCNKWFEKNNK